jgi:uncharacterized membrane protein YccC
MLPGPENWLFSLKTFGAAMLAFSVCLWLDLARPYWAVATVYIASHPLSGATRSKAIFRALGTLLGSAAAILLVPNLASAPLLLVLAIALWCALCLYISLLDRTPRSYVFMLAGYTAALIGFPTVDAPGAIFDIALSRTEEILTGILCAALVSSVVFPRSVGPVLALRLNNWFHHADVSASDTLLLEKGRSTDTHRLRLAADTIEIENLASFLSFDATKDASATQWLRQLQPRMLMLLPILSSISDKLGELTALGGPSQSAEALLSRARLWLQDGQHHDPLSLEALRRDIGAETGRRHTAGGWRDLIELSFLLRLRDFVDLRADCANVAEAVRSGSASLPRPLLFPIEERIARVRHYDHGLALFAAGVNAITILICCAFWIFAAWPDGASAAMLAAVATSLFAAQDNPAPTIVVFTKAAAVAVLMAGLYVFAFLPAIHNLETLILLLAPAFLAFGHLISTPQTTLIGVPLAVITATVMALQETYGADAAAFLNSSIGLILGMALAAGASAILITLGAEWGVWRISRANRATLAKAANTTTDNEEALVAGLLIDRMLLLAPRAAQAGHTMPDVLRELRAGFNILDLHRAQRALPAHSRRLVGDVLSGLAHLYRSGTAPAAGQLEAIDRALAATRDESSGRMRDALIGLAGLRRTLFPGASAPALPQPLKAAA